MRFTISKALDSIEQRLTTDPVLAAAVVDLPSVVRHNGLDDGRPANLLRLGMVIDALARYLNDDSVAVFPVTDRGLMSDNALTSNEKMVIRRWCDDGLAEVVPDPVARLLEVADLTGLPVITRRDLRPYAEQFAGIVGTSRHLIPMPGMGGAVLAPSGNAIGVTTTPGAGHPVLRRRWWCPDATCVAFGISSTAQPPPTVIPGPVPDAPPQVRCPRHGQPLTDAGPAPEAVPMLVVVSGVPRHRFVVRADQPVTVGRNPDQAPSVRLGLLLDEETARLVSRSHLRMELSGGALSVVDTSTNGTAVLSRSGPDAEPQRIEIGRGERRTLGQWDTVELHTGVELVSARHWRGGATLMDPSSTLADAPTMAFRAPTQR